MCYILLKSNTLCFMLFSPHYMEATMACDFTYYKHLTNAHRSFQPFIPKGSKPACRQRLRNSGTGQDPKVPGCRCRILSVITGDKKTA
jgi:hypothetical protein